MNIRIAQQQDLPALLDIYNEEVLGGTATFDIHPQTLAERQHWFDEHNQENHPLLVAEMDGQVAGYASLSGYRSKEAYSATVELSIYVGKAYRRQGVAKTLMKAILALARGDERTHRVVSVITGGNEASIRLHERFGFTHCGTIHEVGRKFGRYLNTDTYELPV